MSEKIIYVGNAAFTSKGLLSAVYQEKKVYLSYDHGRNFVLPVESEEAGNKTVKSIYEQWVEKPKIEVSLDASKVTEMLDKTIERLESELKKPFSEPYTIIMLELGDKVYLFGTSYEVCQYGDVYFLQEDSGMSNDKCFEDAGIPVDGKGYFVEDVVGYRPGSGIFPEVKSLYDLSLVYDRLKKIETDKTSKQ